MIALLQICWEIKMDVASMYNELMEAAAPASHCKLLFQTFSSYRCHLKSQNHLDWKMPLRSTPATSLALPSPPLNHSLSTMVYTSSKYLQGWWLNTGYCKAIAVLDITARYHLLSQEKDVKNQLLMDGRERGQAVMVVFFFFAVGFLPLAEEGSGELRPPSLPCIHATAALPGLALHGNDGEKGDIDFSNL